MGKCIYLIISQNVCYDYGFTQNIKNKVIIMKRMSNTFLLADDKVLPEMHLKQPGFT